ncbi:MAG: glycosyltransferase family 4 protein [Deferribacteraceae bacterium]|jgi:glycosyltransferase involved in cell wall biosynthesis|nr:glycosyltransferase family 4 protein [Deferribacteraceae bacterium]
MSKRSLIFDATILASILHKNSNRSGILWVAYNILKEFVRQDNFDISLYCAHDKAREILSSDNPYLKFVKKLPIVNFPITEPVTITRSTYLDLKSYSSFMNVNPHDDWGIWTGAHSSFRVKLNNEEIKTLEIAIETPMIFQSVQSFSITNSKGRIYASYKKVNFPQSVQFTVPKRDITNDFTVNINVEGASSPKSEGVGEDPRTLGVGISSIIIKIDGVEPKPKKKKNIKGVDLFFQKVYHKLYTKGVNCRYLKDYDLFISPVHKVPDEVARAKNIEKYTILYDIAPFVLADYNKGSGEGWLRELVYSMNKRDRYFSISEHTKSDFLDFLPQIDSKQITVIPLSTGVSYKVERDKSKVAKVKAKYNIPTDKRYIFSLCTMEPRKNLIFAVKNFVRFVRESEIDDMILVLGGGHWAEFIDKLREVVNDLGDSSRYMQHIGYVDDEDMNTLYSGAEFFVYPSLYEGFGMPILEAMKSGCPVICSNTSSMPEVIGKAGITVDPTDDAHFVHALKKMYYDSAFREQCVKRGLAQAKLFSWKRAVDIMTNTINGDGIC